MTKRTQGWIGAVLFVAWVLCLCGQMASGADANDPGGLTVWGLAGDLQGNGLEEGRVGYLFNTWHIEPMIGLRHLDTQDSDETEEWPITGYVAFHGLDLDMLMQVLRWDVNLPDGAIYAGPFAQYSHDRENEWCGGPFVGACVDLETVNPNWAGWFAVTEIQWKIWNVGDDAEDEYTLLAGLRREF